MKIKLLISMIIINFIILLVQLPTYAEEQIHISAKQAILMDQHSGRVIFEKSAYEKRPIASITKVMTALLAIEYGTLTDEVRISERAAKVGGSSIYLKEDEKMTLEDLLYGLMLRSGNDAAVAIAEHIAGSVEGFVYLMNEKADYLGMTDTKFQNPHGLDETNHYSSAYDIALLMRHAMENESFQSISRTKSYHAKTRDYQWFNKNKLLTHLYEYSTGGKTGFTKQAGRTLVSTAEKNGMSLIVVTLHAPSDWHDHMHLYETYFDKLHNVLLEKKGKRLITINENTVTTGVIDEQLILPLLPEEKPYVKKTITVNPKKEASLVATVAIQIKDETIATVPIYERKPFFHQIIQMLLQMMGTKTDG